MAGKPGKSGGARLGSGPKKREPSIAVQALAHEDPQSFLLGIMSAVENDARLRVYAAKALLPYMYAKKGEGGKKDAQRDAAKQAVSGKFTPSAPPLKLVR